MNDFNFSVLDLLDLPQPEREVFLHVARHGPADAAALAAETGHSLTEIQQVLEDLAEKGRVTLTADGEVNVRLGRIQPRTTLPARLEPGSLASGRLYSEQELAALRTAIPMLQFARAKLTEFNDHGPNHVLRVKSFATQLGYVLGLTPTERHLLRAAAYFHDIGNVIDRKRHHITSQETVEKLSTLGRLPFTPKEAELVGLLCRWHRKAYDPQRVDVLREERVRTGLLASVLRVADAMDLDYRRADHSQKFRQIIDFFYPQDGHFWTSMDETLGVRIRCNPEVELQIFTRGHVTENTLISSLQKDLCTTPLASPPDNWRVRVLPSGKRQVASSAARTSQALLVFPLDAHSLVMAALSRKQLMAAGYVVECLCYPDTADGPAWLWRETLPSIKRDGFERLVVVGDRPDGGAASDLLQTMAQWRSAGVAVSWLNRYEANWAYLPQLLALGVDVVLGGDGVYFWGDTVSEGDLMWARVAALCTRDPTMAAVAVIPEEQTLTRGLLAVILDALRQPARDTAGWFALAEPVLDRIAADDWAFFTSQAGRFVKRYATAVSSYRVDGRVLLFDRSPGAIPAANYWVLERAIEERGRRLERGIHFKVPYALAVWPVSDGQVELLALSHWREEEAIPMRLLYPTDLGPRPHGHESTLNVRLPAEQAPSVIRALVASCNRGGDFYRDEE